jgi:hypothetical protein
MEGTSMDEVVEEAAELLIVKPEKKITEYGCVEESGSMNQPNLTLPCIRIKFYLPGWFGLLKDSYI